MPKIIKFQKFARTNPPTVRRPSSNDDKAKDIFKKYSKTGSLDHEAVPTPETTSTTPEPSGFRPKFPKFGKFSTTESGRSSTETTTTTTTTTTTEAPLSRNSIRPYRSKSHYSQVSMIWNFFLFFVDNAPAE